MSKCKKCDGDGYLDVMDPDHYGAVIGARECPKCGGTGQASVFDEDDEDEGDNEMEGADW